MVKNVGGFSMDRRLIGISQAISGAISSRGAVMPQDAALNAALQELVTFIDGLHKDVIELQNKAR